MLLKKGFQSVALMAVLLAACLWMSACSDGKKPVRGSVEATSVVQEGAEKGQTTESEKESAGQEKTGETTSITQGEGNSVNDEIYAFMQEFMVFPVIWDFDQQDMSGAVDYFAQKWVWTDVTAMEYDAERKAYYVNFKDFIEEMGQYFVLPPSYQWREGVSINAGMWLVADLEMPWGFDFVIDQVEERDGAYYVHGRNAEVTENPTRASDAFIIGSNTEPFLEFDAVIVRDENDGKLRLRELKGLENGPGRKVNVSEVSDDVSKELADFAKFFAEGPVLEGFDVNDLTCVFDFSAQKILQTKPEAVKELDDGRCIVALSELTGFMDQYFYLPKGYEKSLPKEEEGVYPCLAEDGVIFLKKEIEEGFEVRTDPPAVQNNRYYFYGAYIEDAEQQSPFDLVVIKAARGEDGKLRLLYFKPYDL